jgi:hypothetical protein
MRKTPSRFLNNARLEPQGTWLAFSNSRYQSTAMRKTITTPFAIRGDHGRRDELHAVRGGHVRHRGLLPFGRRSWRFHTFQMVRRCPWATANRRTYSVRTLCPALNAFPIRALNKRKLLQGSGECGLSKAL